MVVVAVRPEAAYLKGIDVVLTGIGKVAAAVAVSAAIAERRPSFVLNVGTAGALRDGLEGAHTIGRVVEHDVDHAALSALIGEEVSGEVVLDRSSSVTLATGDAFVADPDLRLALSMHADLVDMEGYAIARACERAGVECRMVKVVSDAADAEAGLTWKEQADRTAREIAAIVDVQLSR